MRLQLQPYCSYSEVEAGDSHGALWPAMQIGRGK